MVLTDFGSRHDDVTKSAILKTGRLIMFAFDSRVGFSATAI